MREQPVGSRCTALESWVPAGVILALGAILRLGWPELTEFKLDEATLIGLAHAMVRGDYLSLAGPATSQGLTNGPWSIYLLAIPSLISRNPIVATLFVGMLNLLAVLGTYFLARRWWGQHAAWVAGLLYAASPWAIFSTRKLWVQSLTPPFIVLYAGAACAFLEGRRRALALHLVALAFLLQIYPAALALVPVTLLVIAIRWRHVSWRVLLIAVAVGAVIFAPYALDQARRGWPDARTAFHLAKSDATVDGQALQFAWMMTVGSNLHSLAGANAFHEYLATTPNLNFLLTLEGLLVIAGAIWLLRSWLRPSANTDPSVRSISLFLLVWTLIPILLLIRHTMPIYPHYFLVLLPAPYLMAGSALQSLGDWARTRSTAWQRWIPSAILLVPGAIALYQTILILTMFRFVAGHSTSGFGIPLAYRLEAARRVREVAADLQVAEVVVVSEGDNPAWHETPAVFDVLLGDIPGRRYINGPTMDYALLPASPAVVLVAPGEWPAESLMANWADLTPIADVPLRPGEGRYRILSARPRTDGLQEIRPPARLNNGAELIGYGWSGELRAGQTFQLAVLWRITAGEKAEYHFFNHLMDAQGERRGQKDGLSVPLRDWRPSGPFLSVFTISLASELPSGPYWIRTGMYRYPEIQNVPVLDELGQPMGDAVMLGPIWTGGVP